MDKLLNAITEDEYGMFGYRCNHYRDDECEGDRFVTPRTILSKAWAPAKGDLFDLFGEQLILSKEIELNMDIEILTREFGNRIENGGPIWNFMNKLLYKKYDDLCRANGGSAELYYAIHQNWSAHSLATNEVDEWCRLASGTLPDGTKIAFTKGAKIMRIYAKIAHAFNLDAEFEAARLEHSQVLNQKKLTGELCLSIHPLDYSTMSDNSNGWVSCMSWDDYGEFRQGTVEMMNSPSVIVAYLKSDKYELINGRFSWNSKKWRELFIVHPDLITGIKGYPYQCTQLEYIIMDWLRELAQKNWECEYGETYEWRNGSTTKAGCKLYFSTGQMYNDFGSRNGDHTHLLAEGKNLSSELVYDFNYSGLSQCMCCGSIDDRFEHEGSLNCLSCVKSYTYCDDCGRRIMNEDDIGYINGVPYCESCYGYHYEEDIITGEERDTNNRSFIQIVPDNADYEEIRKAWEASRADQVFPIYVGYAQYNVQDYFEHHGVQQYVSGTPHRLQVTNWNHCDYLYVSQLKDAFFDLDWVEEHIGTREDLLRSLEEVFPTKVKMIDF